MIGKKERETKRKGEIMKDVKIRKKEKKVKKID